jgi:F0F1-type ATP synthase membrane subunit a
MTQNIHTFIKAIILLIILNLFCAALIRYGSVDLNPQKFQTCNEMVVSAKLHIPADLTPGEDSPATVSV